MKNTQERLAAEQKVHHLINRLRELRRRGGSIAEERQLMRELIEAEPLELGRQHWERELVKSYMIEHHTTGREKADEFWARLPLPRGDIQDPLFEYRILQDRKRVVREALPLIAEDIHTVFSEASAIYLVGSYARGEPRIDSDVDILIVFPEGTDGWEMVKRDDVLWRKWNRQTLGVTVDFIVYVASGAIVGKHRERLEAELPVPMVQL